MLALTCKNDDDEDYHELWLELVLLKCVFVFQWHVFQQSFNSADHCPDRSVIWCNSSRRWGSIALAQSVVCSDVFDIMVCMLCTGPSGEWVGAISYPSLHDVCQSHRCSEL